MSFLQHILLLFIVIFVNVNSTSIMTPESTTAQSIYAQAVAEILKTESDLKRDEEQLRTDRKKFEEEKNETQKNINGTDIFRVNVGGDIIMTTRLTLTRIPKSILSIIFNGRWEHKLQRDQEGNIFFDFNPIVFRHLLDQLQLDDINNLNHISPPSQPSLVTPFKKMIHKLGLNQSLSFDKNIITFNVGGQMITNQRRTFTQVSNSTYDTILSPTKSTNFNDKSDVFVDSNPKLFRHLVSQLRELSMKNKPKLKSPSNEEKTSFQRMLKDLGVYQQPISPTYINNDTNWKQHGVTVTGGNGQGNQLNQLYYPRGISVDDDDQCIYIADRENHRIVQWKYGAKNGQVVAGGNGKGNRMDQLDGPTDVLVNKRNDSLIICDHGNRRVVRWSRQNPTKGQTIIPDIDCWGLAMDNNGELYVSDYRKDEVRRWKIGKTNGAIVAGGNGNGNNLNRLNDLTYIFVDENHSVYVSDYNNHRVMKWMKGAKEGMVVAGGQGQGNSLTQLSYPHGVIVDHLGNVYVADCFNHRIMRWSSGAHEGSIVVGGNGEGQQPNQFSYPEGLSFDRQGNLYVVDHYNHRAQRFDIDDIDVSFMTK